MRDRSPPPLPPPRAARDGGDEELVRLRSGDEPILTSSARLYAGFWKRAFAFLVDSTIIFAGYCLLGALPPHITTIRPGAPSWAPTLLSLCLWACIMLYYVVFETSERRATPGKMVMGIIVTDQSNNKISVGRATLRTVVKVAGMGFGPLAGLIVALTPKKQGLHDLVTSCLVINR